MISVIKQYHILSSAAARQLHMDSYNKVIIFERNNLVFIFNFSPQNSIFDYKFHAPAKGSYQVILNSDKSEFGGFNRIDDTIDHVTDNDQMLSIYLTNRTVLVMRKK